jgi:hypothetical protein
VLAGVALSLGPFSRAAVAQTVYRSIEDGVPTFSDSPPASGPAEEIVIDVAEPAPDPELEKRLAALRETTDRMADDRREREEHRAKLRELRRAVPEPAEPQSTVVVAEELWPAYVRPRPLWQPYLPLRPRPPLRPTPAPLPSPPPGWSVMKPGNAQLMRPVVSGRQ